MNHFQSNILLPAPPGRVYQALSTQSGLRNWWTQSCEAATEVGGRITFRFDRCHKVMAIDSLVPDREVRWQRVEAHIEAPGVDKADEWVGTHIVFKLTPQDRGQTLLEFEHIGLTPELQCFEVCQGGWHLFLGSLQNYVTTGQGKPFAPPSETDRLERSVFIQSPRSRVWQAISNATAFGQWFGAKLAGDGFAPGQHVRGPITICGHENVVFDALIERVEPEQLLSYRWHPFAIDPAVDYSVEPRTLVTFTLSDAEDGTLLTVVESGFDQVPPARRLIAFQMNGNGWEGQMRNIIRHVNAA